MSKTNRHTVPLISTSSVVHPPSFHPFSRAGFSVHLIFISILPFFIHLHTFHPQIQPPQPVSPLLSSDAFAMLLTLDLPLIRPCAQHTTNPTLRYCPSQQVRLFLPSCHDLPSDIIPLVAGPYIPSHVRNSPRLPYYLLRLVGPSFFLLSLISPSGNADLVHFSVLRVYFTHTF